MSSEGFHIVMKRMGSLPRVLDRSGYSRIPRVSRSGSGGQTYVRQENITSIYLKGEGRKSGKNDGGSQEAITETGLLIRGSSSIWGEQKRGMEKENQRHRRNMEEKGVGFELLFGIHGEDALHGGRKGVPVVLVGESL